ncbi:MAG: TSUP family transporter [Methylococcaceae bacterium]
MIEYVWLFIGAFLSAAISGAAGFGGALLLLPLLTRTVGAELAVPLLTFAQLIGNLSRVTLGFKQIHWRPVALFLGTALPAAVLGAFSFISIPKTVAVRFIGIAILGFVILRIVGKLRFESGTRTLLVGGLVTGFISGLVGSAGPLGAAVFLSLGLPPVAYIASEATTALALHAAKLLIYQQQLVLSAGSWQLAFLLGMGMILGTWASKRVIERLPVELFRQFVTVLLGIIAVQMVIFG